MTDNISRKSAPREFTEAITRKDEEAVRDLLTGGTNVNEEDEVGRSMLHLAADFGQINIARLLIEAGADVNKASRALITPLMGAVHFGHSEIARLLLDAGADVNAKSERNWTAAIYASKQERHASRQERKDILRLLIERGADISVQNRNGESALDIAERRGLTEMVQILKEAPQIQKRIAEEARHIKVAEKQAILQKHASHIKLKPRP